MEKVIGFDLRLINQANYSVDDNIWTSAFDGHVSNKFDWKGPTAELWDSLPRLLETYSSSGLDVGVDSQYVLVAITEVVSGSRNVDHEIVVTPEEFKRKDWCFLGFDVADFFLRRCETDKLTVQIYSKIAEAKEMRQLLDEAISSHKPFYVYGLYTKLI